MEMYLKIMFEYPFSRLIIEPIIYSGFVQTIFCSLVLFQVPNPVYIIQILQHYDVILFLDLFLAI